MTNPTSSPISYDQYIYIPKVGLNHAGFYYCYGFNSVISKYFIGRAQLKVYGEIQYLNILNSFIMPTKFYDCF